jgi:hypothetical protein
VQKHEAGPAQRTSAGNEVESIVVVERAAVDDDASEDMCHGEDLLKMLPGTNMIRCQARYRAFRCRRNVVFISRNCRFYIIDRSRENAARFASY